jgi:hypothetical protein
MAVRQRAAFTAGILGLLAGCATNQSIKQSCNVVPLMACGTPLPKRAPAHWYYGYTENAPIAMKLPAGGGSAVGLGNFQLIQLPGGSGANWIGQNLAGRYNECLVKGNSIQTQPDDERGPVAQGLFTRFGDYVGNLSGSQAQYPPDVITTQTSPRLSVLRPGLMDCSSSSSPCIYGGGMSRAIVTANNMDSLGVFDYKAYEAALKAQQYTNAPPDGQFNRRILSVPVGNCSGNSGGSSSIPIIGFACFFMLQEPTQVGNTVYILGQYVSNCKH